MQIKEIMSSPVKTIPPGETLQQAARLMKEFDIGELPVGEPNDVEGLLTDRDITLRCVAEGRDPTQTRVADVMTNQCFWCYQDQDLQEACRTMEANQIRRIMVMNRNKKLVGVISIGDLAKRGDTERFAEQVMHAVCQKAKAA